MCYPVKLLEVEKFNTKETILIKRYLLVRIETMKNARNNVSAKKIIYDRIDKKIGERSRMFAYLGYSEENYSNWRKKRGTIHNTVCAIVDSFIENAYILNYRIIKGENRRSRNHSLDGFEGKPPINGYAMPLNASQNCTNDQRDEINMNKEAVFVKID